MTPNKNKSYSPSMSRLSWSPQLGRVKKTPPGNRYKETPLSKGLFSQSINEVTKIDNGFNFFLEENLNLHDNVRMVLSALQLLLSDQDTLMKLNDQKMLKYHGVGSTISVSNESSQIVFVAKQTVEQCQIQTSHKGIDNIYSMVEFEGYNSKTFSLYGHIQSVFKEIFNIDI
jgi:hypothetical protein